MSRILLLFSLLLSLLLGACSTSPELHDFDGDSSVDSEDCLLASS
jgi:starvation-inducible outer membrane lipoprotein